MRYFRQIGFTREHLKNLTDYITVDYFEDARMIEFADGYRCGISVDENIEFWYNAEWRGEETIITDDGFIYMTEWLEAEAVRPAQDIMGGNNTLINFKLPGVPYEMNMYILDFVTPKIIEGEKYLVNFAAFANDINIITDYAAFKKENGISLTALVDPYGTRSAAEGEERGSEGIFISGAIKAIDRKINPATKVPYYVLTVMGEDIDFTVLVSEADANINGKKMRTGAFLMADCSIVGRLVNKRVGDDFDKGTSKEYAWGENDGPDTFTTEIAPFIFNMDEKHNEYLVLDFEENTLFDDLSYMQTIRESENFLIEIALDLEGELPTIYRMREKELLRVVAIFRDVCLKRQLPDLTTWEDVTEEVFAEIEAAQRREAANNNADADTPDSDTTEE